MGHFLSAMPHELYFIDLFGVLVISDTSRFSKPI